MGWSVDGRMAGSDAVVGNSDTPGLYTLTSTAPGDQHLMITTSLVGGMETTPNLKYPDGKFIKFSRTEGTGHVPVKLSGPSAIIYAFSADGSTAFSYHGPNSIQRHLLYPPHFPPSLSTLTMLLFEYS
ncbi:unnamed protein product [Closterium sp. NIES-54]